MLSRFYIVFIIGRWFYFKFLKEKSELYFYLLSLKMDKENNHRWYLRVESPKDDLEIHIEVTNASGNLLIKNAHLKAGINKIALNSEGFDSTCSLKIQSDSQTIERSFVEVEL